MIHDKDLETVARELAEKASAQNPRDGTYSEGFIDGLEWARRRIRWLQEGLYERERLEKEKP